MAFYKVIVEVNKISPIDQEFYEDDAAKLD